MSINNKNFVNELRNRFIKILDSKRGIQSYLAKSIGKPSSYFSEIKRGNPVNALHLKAAGIVLGHEKVIELLDIDNKTGGEENNPSKVDYPELLELYKQKELALEINKNLLQLELFDEKEIEGVNNFIKFRLLELKEKQPKIENKKTPIDSESQKV